MTVRLAASGKVFLAGEYAVLDPGRPALVAGIDWKMHAVAEPGARGVQIVHRPSGLLWDGGQAPAELRFAARAALLAMAFCRKPDGVRISFEDDLSREGRKLGLGGSAAACVLAVRAVCALADRRSGEDEILALAVAAHWAEQGGMGSGADVAAAALGGILEVRSRIAWQSAGEVMALPADRVAASRPIDVRRVAVPLQLRLLLVDAGEPANTRLLVREVMRAFRSSHRSWPGRALSPRRRELRENRAAPAAATAPWSLPSATMPVIARKRRCARTFRCFASPRPDPASRAGRRPVSGYS
ncbi:MAG: hypothetical protein E6J65_23215 [Deltaproteobacteria bacterium]|nr:MAG: hypothetical protein E6J65_23215 [Deltaproteobacteria bacterium]